MVSTFFSASAWDELLKANSFLFSFLQKVLIKVLTSDDENV